MGSKGSQKTTQAYTPAAATGAAGEQALTMAQTAANQPFQQPIAPVAGFTGDQYSAFENMRNLQGAAQPYMNRAGQLFDQSASPISGQQVGNYLNPYANYVMSGMENLFGQQRKDQTGRLVQAAGGQGADRIALAQGNLAREQGQAAGQTLSGIYGSALGAAQQDASRQQAAGFGFGQLGPAIQNAMMNGTQGLFNFGGIQQQQQQAQLNAPYQNELARIAYPFQTAQFLSGTTAQTAPALGGTTTNTYPAPSPWGTIAGLGMTGLGAFMGNPAMMGAGLKGTMGAPQTGGMMSGGYGNGGWNPNVSGGYVYPSARGGAVPYKYGGAVDLEDIGGSYQEGGDVGNTSLEFDPNWDQFNQNRFGVFGPPMPQAIGPEPPNPQAGPMPQMPPQLPGPMMSGPPNGAPMPMPSGPPNAAPIEVDRSQLPPQFFAAEDPGVDSAPGMPPTALGMAAAPTRAARPAMPPPPPQAMLPQQEPMTDLDLPPDPNEGSWSRGPGAALMAAGFATLKAAGDRDLRGLPKGPFAAIGEGGGEGLKFAQHQDTAATQRRRVELESKRLINQAEHQRSVLTETKRFHDMTDLERRDRLRETMLERRERSSGRISDRQERDAIRAEEARVRAMAPVKIGTDPLYGDVFAIRDPRSGRLIPIDPKTGQLKWDGITGGIQPAPADPANPANPAGPTAPPIAQPPAPTGGTPPGAPLVPPTAPSAPPQSPQTISNPEEEIPATAQPVQNPEIPSHLKSEVLQGLEPRLAGQVKALSEGRIPFPSGQALRTPYWQTMLQLVSQYDPSFDAVNYNARAKTRNDFTSGKSAQNITSFNTTINHLASFEASIDRLKNTSFPFYNKIANAMAVQTGDTEMQRARNAFQAAKTALTEELTRAFRGTGGNVHDIKNWEKALNDSDSPQGLRESVKTAIELLRGRITSVGEQYNRGMGTVKDPVELLSPAAITTLKRIEDRISEDDAPRRPERGKQKGAPKPKAKEEPVERKTINGVGYHKKNGQWFRD